MQSKDRRLQSSRLAEFGGGPFCAVTHRTAFTVRCGYLLADVFLNDMLRPAFLERLP
jgi:hypothetical protein